MALAIKRLTNIYYMANTVQLTKDGQPVFPVTDVSLVMGLQDAIKLPPVKVTTLPTASNETAGKMYYVGPDTNDEYERYITSATNGSYEWIDLGDTSIPLPSIADNLTTTDANTALSANQGNILDGKISQLQQELFPYKARRFYVNSPGWGESSILISTTEKKVTLPAGAFRISGNKTLSSLVYAAIGTDVVTDFVGGDSMVSGCSVGLYAEADGSAVYLVAYGEFNSFITQHPNSWELGRGVMSLNTQEYNLQVCGNVLIDGKAAGIPRTTLLESDIVDNCFAGGVNKPLSAEQGKYLYPYRCRNFYVNTQDTWVPDGIHINTTTQKVTIKGGMVFRIVAKDSLSSIKYTNVSSDLETSFVGGELMYHGASVGLYAVYSGSSATLLGVYLVVYNNYAQFMQDNTGNDVFELGRGIIDNYNRLFDYISANGTLIIDGVTYRWGERVFKDKAFGKTIGVFGGSLSVYPASQTAKNIWRERLSCTITDYGEGGAGFSSLQGGDVSHDSIQVQVNNATSKDIYILWASTNDFTNSRQIGEYSDYTEIDNYDETKLVTQCGGINYCIKTLLTINPDAEIYFFTSLRFFSRNSGYNPYSTDTNSIGKTFAEYVEAQKKCCAYYGIPILDQFNLQGVNIFNYTQYYNNDGIHMTEDGYKKIGYIQADFLANGK